MRTLALCCPESEACPKYPTPLGTFCSSRRVRSPEMFELRESPSGWDSETNSVKAGMDRVTLFAGATLALQELSTQERFSETQVAVASATSRKASALECLRLFEVLLFKVAELWEYVVHLNRRGGTPDVCTCMKAGAANLLFFIRMLCPLLVEFASPNAS